MQNNKSYYNQVSSCLKCNRPTWQDAEELAEKQINLASIYETDRSFAAEIIKIIAEVYLMPDNARIRIGREYIDGYLLKQIFAQLNEQHVQLVIDNFSQIHYKVHYKKSYLRTALYNCVFEFEADYTNQLQQTQS